MIEHIKTIAIIVLLVVCGTLGIAYERMAKKPSVSSSTSQTTTTTVEHKPDGTTIQTTTNSNTSTSDVKPTVPDKSRYRVDVLVNPMQLRDIQVNVGARIGNLPLFGILGASSDRSIHAGISLEF